MFGVEWETLGSGLNTVTVVKGSEGSMLNEACRWMVRKWERSDGVMRDGGLQSHSVLPCSAGHTCRHNTVHQIRCDLLGQKKR